MKKSNKKELEKLVEKHFQGETEFKNMNFEQRLMWLSEFVKFKYYISKNKNKPTKNK